MTQFAFTGRIRQLRLRHPAASRRGAARPRPARNRHPDRRSRTWRPTRPPSTPAATTPNATSSTGSRGPPTTRCATTARASVFDSAGRRVRRASASLRRDRPHPHLLRRRRVRRAAARSARRPRAAGADRVAGLHRRLPRRALTPGDPHGQSAARYLTPGRSWPAEYPAEFRTLDARTGRLPPTTDDDDVPGSPGGYYITGARHRYDVHDPTRCRAACRSTSLDPLGAETRIELRPARPAPGPRDRPGRAADPGRLRPAGAAAPRGHRHQRQHQPRSRSPRPASSPPTSVRGKDGDGDGDRSEHPDGHTTCSPSPSAASRCRCAPSAGCTTTPTTDVPAEQRDEVIVSVEYSDGFGRLLQTRTQAEDIAVRRPGVRRRRHPGRPDATRSATTVGRTRRAGRPGQRGRQRLADLRQQGPGGREVRAVLRAPASTSPRRSTPSSGQKATDVLRPARAGDPHRQPGRQRAARRPRRAGRPRRSRTCSRRRRGKPTPTTPTTTPAAPTVATAEQYRDHWNTPASIEVDALGRTVAAVARNGPDPDDGLVRHPLHLRHPGQPAHDHRRRWAARRSATASTCRSAAGGWTASTPAAATPCSTPLGNPVGGRDSKGALTLGAFDVLHRPIRVWARDDARRRRSRCGSASSTATPATPTNRRRPATRPGPTTCSAARSPTTTRPGLLTVADVDFKGNVARGRAAGDRRRADPGRLRPRPPPTAGRSRRSRSTGSPRPGADRGRPRRRAARARPVPRRRPATTRSTGSPRTCFRPTSRAGAASCSPRYNRAGGLEQVPPRRHGLRRAHRLRRQGPAHADRLRQRRDDPLRLRPAAPSGWPGCAASATHRTAA